MSQHAVREQLAAQAAVVEKIRQYFAAQGVLSVETASIRPYGITDPSVCNMRAVDEAGDPAGYLQFSPEFAMKQLISTGSGDIYQICRAYRAGEQGRLHRAEFRILEWYRTGFNHHQMMDDVEQLLTSLLDKQTWSRQPYAELFSSIVKFDPHSASNEQLSALASQS
ncbi:MAG: amino acid--tRNA ligase-related protein, partial [Pseudomonadota bacterium]